MTSVSCPSSVATSVSCSPLSTSQYHQEPLSSSKMAYIFPFLPPFPFPLEACEKLAPEPFALPLLESLETAVPFLQFADMWPTSPHLKHLVLLMSAEHCDRSCPFFPHRSQRSGLETLDPFPPPFRPARFPFPSSGSTTSPSLPCVTSVPAVSSDPRNENSFLVPFNSKNSRC